MANENKKIIFSTENPNGILVDMTTEELAVREQDAINHQAIVQEQTDFETNKASAKAKLISGEALTEEEANTIVF
jgi:hypothetical protein